MHVASGSMAGRMGISGLTLDFRSIVIKSDATFFVVGTTLQGFIRILYIDSTFSVAYAMSLNELGAIPYICLRPVLSSSENTLFIA